MSGAFVSRDLNAWCFVRGYQKLKVLSTKYKAQLEPFCLAVARYMVGGGQTGQRGRARMGKQRRTRLPRGAAEFVRAVSVFGNARGS